MMNNRFLLLLLGGMLMSLVACNKASLESQVLKDVRYGNDVRNVMDVYLPEGRNDSTPFIILLHPGAWMSGDKEIMTRMADSLINLGVGVANINTRFVSASEDISLIFEDIDKVLMYCYSHSGEWKIRSKGIAIGGSSSGGHIAMLYAYTTAYVTHLSAVVAFATPSNVADTAWLRAMVKEDITEKVEWMCGKNYDLGTIPDSVYYMRSPIYHIANIPTFLVHGDMDNVIPYTQSEQLVLALEQQQVPNRLFRLREMGHVIGYQNQTLFSEVIREIQQWLLKYGNE